MTGISATSTDFPAAASTVATALALLDENGDFGTARDNDPCWPAILEGNAIRALRDLRDAFLGRPHAVAALDRAVMIASRQDCNSAPELVTVTLHTAHGSAAVEGRPHGPRIPAPGFPELALPTYTFSAPFSGLSAATNLEAFLSELTEALDRETTRPDGRLILAVHADVPGEDLDDAYAWCYDADAKDFTTIWPAEAADLFHEDTQVLTHSWDSAPYASVPALAPVEPSAQAG